MSQTLLATFVAVIAFAGVADARRVLLDFGRPTPGTTRTVLSAADHTYKVHEKVPLYANKVGPFHNPSEVRKPERPGKGSQEGPSGRRPSLRRCGRLSAHTGAGEHEAPTLRGRALVYVSGDPHLPALSSRSGRVDRWRRSLLRNQRA